MNIEGERPKEHKHLTEEQWRSMVKEDTAFFGEEFDRDIERLPLETRSIKRAIGFGTLVLALALGLGYKYVDYNRDEITAMRERMWAESGFTPKPELTPCQKVTRDGIPAKVGRFVASTAGLCKAELAGMNSTAKTIVSFNTEGQL